MKIPYVSVEKHKGKHWLKVSTGDNTCQRYPLTKAGCIKAGQELFDDGVEEWMCSSTVDHADDFGFAEDIRELMQEGWQSRQDLRDAPRNSMYLKLLAVTDTVAFKRGLTTSEKVAFKELKKRIHELTGVSAKVDNRYDAR